MINWVRKNKMLALAATLVCAASFTFGYALIGPIVEHHIYYDLNEIPNIVERAVEPSGIFGRGEYWVFDEEGNRYQITQEDYDSLIDIPIR